MNNNDTIRKTLIVAVSLCLVCSALISFSAVELRDLQEANLLEPLPVQLELTEGEVPKLVRKKAHAEAMCVQRVPR